MANCVNYDCADTLGTHLLNDCGEELLAGISGTVLLECNHQLTDPSSASQINAEIAAGRATLFDNLKIGLDEPSAVTVDSNIVGGTPKLVTYDRSGTAIDSNVNQNNINTYNQLLGGKVMGGAIMYLKGTEESTAGAKVLWIDAAISFTGGLPIQNDNNVNMFFNNKFTWRKKDMPSLYAAPNGIFT
jgi:hypothetical protein